MNYKMKNFLGIGTATVTRVTSAPMAEREEIVEPEVVVEEATEEELTGMFKRKRKK